MIIFITGGSGSGKSEYAENLAVNLSQQEKGNLVYVATMEPLDEESKRRVQRHQKMRAGKNFETRECYTHLEKLVVKKNEILLLECLSNLTANEMFSEAGRKNEIAEVIQRGICNLAKYCQHFILVGNNVFEDGITYDKMTANYLKQMAVLHRFLGTKADKVIEIIYGIPVIWK
ncbi:MAG: bifunctional adenosylcobinamide kinase/adenosylcobinamide-phosphate guanylyltransferase [Lachnospiraceae bacterium]